MEFFVPSVSISSDERQKLVEQYLGDARLSARKQQQTLLRLLSTYDPVMHACACVA